MIMLLETLQHYSNGSSLELEKFIPELLDATRLLSARGPITFDFLNHLLMIRIEGTQVNAFVSYIL